jgi:hypothetical protein
MSAGENRSRSRSKSRNQNTATLENFQIYNLSFLGIDHLAQGRGDLENATLITVCFGGGFSRIFQGRGLFSESPPRPSAGQNLRGLNLKDVEEKCGKRSDRPSLDPTTLLRKGPKLTVVSKEGE